ncbi:unnamed protein product [Linum trigynum]|uniref:Uncharacterized protein n=1 Tax=Linum trigynum TaxID=586398 RepID=A0AAV2FQ66_9ROSI
MVHHKQTFPILYPLSSSSVSNYPREEIVRDGDNLEIDEEESRARRRESCIGDKRCEGASSERERKGGAIEVVGVEAEAAKLGEWLEEEQVTPRQSQGASGMEGSQPSRAPSGSWRASLKAVKAWNSTAGTTTVVATARRRRGGQSGGGGKK